MDSAAIRQSLAELDAEYGMDLGHAKPHTADRLRTSGLPDDLVELFTTYWPQTPGRGLAGPFELRSSEQLVTPDLETDLVEYGLLFFATATNGDLVGIEVKVANYPVLIFDHCNLDASLSNFREIAVGLSPTLESFFDQAANDPAMPADYWDVRDG